METFSDLNMTTIKIPQSKMFLLTIAVLLLLFSSGCVYYNTFYHAKKKYKKAYNSQQKQPDGKATESDKRIYEESIKKASKVLTFHPDSKYVDDALYLIGKAYYNIEEWRKSDRKFRELIVNFPESKFYYESVFLLGMCNFQQANYSQAEESFRELLSPSKKNDYGDDAAFMLGEIRYVTGEYSQAMDYYQDMLDTYRKSDLRAKALSRMGNCLFKQKKYETAEDYFQQALKAGPDNDLRYEILYSQGDCMYKLGDYNQGLEIFEDLKGDQKYYNKLPDIKLKLGEGYAGLAENDKALDIYESIPVENANTPQAAQAYYEMGRIYERKGDLNKAKDAYLKGKEQSRESEYAELSLAKSSEIIKLESYRSALEGDTTGSGDLVETRLHLAEAMLFDFSQPDSAVKEYKKIIEDYPYSEVVPLAYFALGYIYRNIKADTAAADSFYIELAGRYPDTRYGLRAAELLGILETFSDSLNTEKMFMDAERNLFEENDPDSAIMIYQEIERNHPGTAYAARAAYAVSYIIDHYIMPADSTAYYSYQHVVERYPETEYADAAKIRLGLVTRGSSRQKIGEMVEEGDTTLAFNPEDTTTYGKVGIDETPEPDHKAEIIWPPEIAKHEHRGYVIMKFYLDIFGAITEVELLTTSGNEELDEAIKQAMLNSSYEAQNMAAEDLNKYYYYRYEFVSPKAQGSGGGGG